MDYSRTIDAGGDATNRLVNRVISLPQGTYRLHFKTDRNHSFERWISFPPDHAYWGICLYEEKPTGIGDMKASCRPAVIIPAEEITPSQRLLDSAIAGRRQESAVNPALNLALAICGMIFLLAIIIWPVGALRRFLKGRKLKAATVSKKKSRLSAAGTCLAWIDGVLSLVYVLAVAISKVLEFYLKYGFDDRQAFVAKLGFMIIPFASACLAILLIVLAFLEWKKRDRSLIGRWFFTLFTATSIAFVLLSGHFYLQLFG